MMTLTALKSNIEWLIDEYSQSIMMIEEDIKDSEFGNNYLIGQLKASKEIIDHLRELLDENNYQK